MAIRRSSSAPLRVLCHTAPRTAALLAAACSLVAVNASRAETKTFSETETDWLVPTNWTPEGVPVATDDVLISAGTVDMALNGSPLTIQTITYSNPLDRLLGNTGETPSTLTLNGNADVNPLISVTSPGQFTIRGGSAGVDVLDLILNGDGAMHVSDPAGRLFISSAIGESGGSRVLTKTGAGTLTLTAVNTFSGGVTIGHTNGVDSGGVLVIDHDARFGAVPLAPMANNINLYNGTLRLTNGTALTTVVTSAGAAGVAGVIVNPNRGMTLNAGNGKIEVPTDQYAEIPGTISDGASGTSPLHKTGGGILDLRTGTNTFTGGVIVDAGILGVTKDANFGADGAPVTIRNGGTIRWYSSGAGPQAGLLAARTLTVGPGGGTVDWSLSSGVPNLNHQIISDAGNTLIKFGNDTLQANVAQPNMNGDLHINQGRWNTQVSGAAGNGTIHLNAPDLPPTGGNGVAQIGIGGTNLQLSVTLENDIVLNPTGQGVASFEVNQSTGTQNELILNGDISGTGGLNKGRVANTGGILTLAGTNTYSGDTSILFGTIKVANGAAIPDSSAVIMPNIVNVKLDLADSSETIGGLSGGGGTGGHVSLGSGTLTINQAADTTFGGVISGAGGSIVKDGAGALALTRDNTYTGSTTLAGGILAIGAPLHLGDAANAVVFNGGTLQTSASVAVARDATVNAAGGTFDTNGFDSTINTITGTGGFTKSGAGKLTANQVKLAGPLTVSAGALEITPNGGAAGTVETTALSLPGGALRLADNDLIVNYADGATSPEVAIRDLVKAGRVDGSTTGIFSTPGVTKDNVVLAVVDNAEWGKLTFNGIDIDTSTVIGKYTYFGDSNLDGKVTGDDYVAIDSNLGTGNSWIEGDFTMDGAVSGDDYVAIDSNLGSGTPDPLAFAELKAEMVALHVEQFGEGYLEMLAAYEAGAAVPEPGALSLIGLGALGLIGRRRRR